MNRTRSRRPHSKAPHLPSKLSNTRVVQRNLVYIIGLSPSIADEGILKGDLFFGQYGKIVSSHPDLFSLAMFSALRFTLIQSICLHTNYPLLFTI